MAVTKTDRITLTPQEVAERWGVAPRTVRAMLDGGTLRGFKTGGGGPKARWHVLLSEVERHEQGTGVAVDA